MPPTSQIVTLKDVYEQLVKLTDEVRSMKPLVGDVADHETRMRALEKWRYALPGSMLLAIGSVAVSSAALALK